MKRKYLSLLLAAFATQMALAEITPPADRVLKNGDIYTVNPKQPHAEALAIRDGKIDFVGSNEEVEQWIGEKTQVDDLQGKFVLPGFIDTHAHYAIGATMANAVVLNPADEKEVWIEQIRTFAKENPDLSGIVGLGVMPLKFGQNGPSKELLDTLVPDRPAIILDDGGHTAWVNSKAYQLANITKDTPDPVPGVHMYKRKANGEPSGWNLEAMTIYPLIRDLKLFSPEVIEQNMEMVFPQISSVGVTTYYDAGMNQVEDLIYPALRQLEEKGKLPFKVVGSYIVQSPTQAPLAIEKIKQLQKDYSSPLIYPNTVKIHNDGTLEAETAALFEDYSDAIGNKGGILLEGEPLNQFVAEIAKNDLNIHMHAIGDKTVSKGLDAFEYARKTVPNTKSRFTLAHVILTQDKDLPRFGELDVIAQTTPAWMTAEAPHSHALGEERSKKRYRIKSMEDGGAKVTFGSDFPVGGEFGLYPLYNIEAGMTRRPFDDDQAVALPLESEKMSLESMIKGYTSNAAYQLNMENEIGTLEKGKAADIVVLDKNLFTLPPEKIHIAEVEMTIMNGKTTYQKP